MAITPSQNHHGMNLNNDTPDANRAVASAPEPDQIVLSGGGGMGTDSLSASLKKRTWKKPKDKPKRPLSSYNLFFRK